MWRKLWRKHVYVFLWILLIKRDLIQIKVDSSLKKWPAMTVVRHRQVCRRFTLIFTPVVRAPCFVNSKRCGLDVVRPAYVGKLSYDRLWIDRQILILHERTFILVFRHKEWLVEDNLLFYLFTVLSLSAGSSWWCYLYMMFMVSLVAVCQIPGCSVSLQWNNQLFTGDGYFTCAFIQYSHNSMFSLN